MNLFNKNERPVMLPGCIKENESWLGKTKSPCMRKWRWAGPVAGQRNTHLFLDKKAYPCFNA